MSPGRSYSQLERETVVWQDRHLGRAAVTLDRTMNVIPFPRERSQVRFARPVEPPTTLSRHFAPASETSNADDLEDRRRMQQNVAAFLLVVALLLIGAWMIERLQAYSRTLACLEAGHRYCAILDPRHLPGR